MQRIYMSRLRKVVCGILNGILAVVKLIVLVVLVAVVLWRSDV